MVGDVRSNYSWDNDLTFVRSSNKKVIIHTVIGIRYHIYNLIVVAIYLVMAVANLYTESVEGLISDFCIH